MFLYFVPTGGNEAPLAYAFDGAGTRRGVMGEGPGDGRAGEVIVNDLKFTTRLAYKRNLQTWRLIPGTELMVGWYNEAPPTLDDVKRKKQVPGRVVEGMHIPISRSWNNDGDYIIQLPRYIEVGEEGQPISGDVIESCANVWELSQTIMDKLFDNAVDNALAVEYAWQILAINYHVGPVECSVLKLLQLETCWTIINTFLELDQLAEIQKKTQVETFSSSDGQKDSTPDTVLAPSI